MSKAIAIARREIHERSFVFVVAAGIAASPFLSLLVGNGGFAQRLELARIIGVVGAVAFVLGLAVMLGASIVGRESREKRLSFYFARPVGGSTIWYGKMIAAVLLLGGCAAIMFAPTIGLTESGWRTFWELPLKSFIGVSLAGAFALMVFSHAASTILRSRSLLIFADFALAVVFLLVTAWMLLGGLAAHQAATLFKVLLVAVIVAVTVILFFAGAWQLSRGRIDPKRGHRELSLFTWSCVTVCVVVLAAVTTWIGAVTVSDLKAKYAQQTNDGQALMIEGIAAHRLDYRAHFLTDVATGRTMRNGWFSRSEITTSGDGSTVAWVEPDSTTMLKLALSGQEKSGGLAFRLMTAPLQRQGQPRDTGIGIESRVFTFVLSHDGSRAAIMSDGIVTVYDIATRKNLGAARIPVQKAWGVLQFVTPDDLRVFVRQGDERNSVRLKAYDFAVGRHVLRPLLDVTMPVDWIQYVPSPDGTRLLARASRGNKAGLSSRLSTIVFDLTSGRQMFEITPSGGRVYGSFLFRDGRTAVLGGGEVGFGTTTSMTLSVYDDKGSLLRSIDLGQATRARIEGEVEPGVLAIATSASVSVLGKRDDVHWMLDRVDVNSGARSRIGTDLTPVRQFPYGVAATQPVPRATRVFSDAKGEHFFAVDLRTGARRKLL